MTTSKDNTQHSKNEHHGKQGFASMPKEKVQEIASKGGQSHGKNHDEDNRGSSSNRSESKHEDDNKHHGKQGFASMPKEKVQEIASKGGQSHGKNHDEDNDDENANKDDHKQRNHNNKK